jgi:diguanylate cyclase (GGDEF)-like protein
MSYAPTKLYVHSLVEQRHLVPADRTAPSILEARREIAALRLINAHLIREVARLKQREAQALRLADRDGLTGLYNHRRMQELLESAIAEAALQGQSVGLLFIDLDGFKGINDEFGHAVGDKVLITVGARIAARTRTGDIVCRYGGDEFVVLLPALPDVGEAAKIADTIRRRLAVPYCIDGHALQLTAAIGVAIYPEDGGSTEALLQRADSSMYRAKALGAGRRQGPDAEPHGPAAESGALGQDTSRPSRRRGDQAKARDGW